LVWFGYLVALGLFFRFQILNGFTLLFSDRYDGFIEISILEHWFNVLKGVEHWSEPSYFFNNTLTLGYNDGYFLYGLIHSLFRVLRCDPLLSAELVNLVVRSIGYWAFYAAGRRILRLGRGWAALAALIFTIGNGAYIHMVHQQLLSVSFAPAMALLLFEFRRRLAEPEGAGVLGWGAAAILLLAAWLMTAFYMAWFFIFFSCCFALVWLPTAGRRRRGELATGLRRHGWRLAALGFLALLANLPLLLLYLPKAAETGMHSYQAALGFSPALSDLVNIGDDSLLYGRLNAMIRHYFRPELPFYGELSTGFPFILLLPFFFGLWRSRGDATLRALGLAACLSWLLLAHFGRFTAYPLVYHLIPGAKAVRVLSRYQLFLAAPLTAVAIAGLARLHWRLALLLPLCGLLVAEEINDTAIIRIDRPAELARLAAIGRPPSGCGAFYASTPRETSFWNPPVEGIYSHSTDAMLVAAIVDLPTINGFATFLPPGYDLFHPEQPDYHERVQAYAEAHGITSLCSLDLQRLRWGAAP
jgi:hypothetical protein